MNAAYVDASALVKLFKAEPETAAFRAALGDWPVQLASELIRVEAICTATRLGDADVLRRARMALERITLVPLSPEIIEPRLTVTRRRCRRWTLSISPPLSPCERILERSSCMTATCMRRRRRAASMPSRRRDGSGRRKGPPLDVQP